jgi:DNA polymerase-1
MKVSSYSAYQLLHHGTLCLSKIERNGIAIDEAYLQSAIHDASKKIAAKEAQMQSSKFGKDWRRRFGDKTKFGSSQQLAVMLRSRGHHLDNTEAGNAKTDAATLSNIDEPFIKDLLECERLKKVRDTFLTGIQREVVNGFAHVMYSLSTAITYRSASSQFNFQNLPIRDEEQSELVRKCFIPRKKKRRLIEVDYGGIEVKIAACYHKDPTMLKYCKDPRNNMHTDSAAQLFGIPIDEVDKDTRYGAKNMFVFPQFYGDYYINCARSLWEWMEKKQLATKSGVSLKKILRKQGIKELGACDSQEDPVPGTFEHHVKLTERHFWNKRFPVYRDWKKSWFSAYQRNGYFETKTGFVIHGDFGRNDVINYPVQGSAFHCLLLALILLQTQIEKRGMKTLLVGQIHDSIIADVPEDETDDYIELVLDIMTRRVPQIWKWIIVPLEAEVEICPLGMSWFTKEKLAND